MGRRNKVIKLTEKKIRYIIRAKTKNDSTKNIALDMKLSESTVMRVWMHWIKHHEPIPIKKFGRKKKEVDEGLEELILKVHEAQKLGARRLEKIIEFKYGKHIPHNRIHNVLLKNGLAKENKNKKKRRKDWIRYERKHSLTAIHLDLHTSKINKKEDTFWQAMNLMRLLVKTASVLWRGVYKVKTFGTIPIVDLMIHLSRTFLLQLMK